MSEKRELNPKPALNGKEQIVSEHASGAGVPDHFAADSESLKSGCGSGCTCSTTSGNPEQDAPMTLAAVREKLNGTKGKRYWRSIDELAGTPEFDEAVQREFPAAAQEWVDPVSRRGFMKLMGA